MKMWNKHEVSKGLPPVARSPQNLTPNQKDESDDESSWLTQFKNAQAEVQNYLSFTITKGIWGAITAYQDGAAIYKETKVTLDATTKPTRTQVTKLVQMVTNDTISQKICPRPEAETQMAAITKKFHEETAKIKDFNTMPISQYDDKIKKLFIKLICAMDHSILNSASKFSMYALMKSVENGTAVDADYADIFDGIVYEFYRSKSQDDPHTGAQLLDIFENDPQAGSLTIYSILGKPGDEHVYNSSAMINFKPIALGEGTGFADLYMLSVSTPIKIVRTLEDGTKVVDKTMHLLKREPFKVVPTSLKNVILEDWKVAKKSKKIQLGDSAEAIAKANYEKELNQVRALIKDIYEPYREHYALLNATASNPSPLLETALGKIRDAIIGAANAKNGSVKRNAEVKQLLVKFPDVLRGIEQYEKVPPGIKDVAEIAATMAKSYK
jgi:hypothetical protein